MCVANWLVSFPTHYSLVTPPPTPKLSAGAYRWDEISPNELRDAIIRVHNTVYSELASIVINMAEFILPKLEIQKFVEKMGARSQLTEAQLISLRALIENHTKLSGASFETGPQESVDSYEAGSSESGIYSII